MIILVKLASYLCYDPKVTFHFKKSVTEPLLCSYIQHISSRINFVNTVKPEVLKRTNVTSITIKCVLEYNDHM